MRRGRRQRGFALVLVLVLLMIAAVALTAAARQSATEALASKQATEELQRRWAVTSCRSTLLPRAAGLLDAAYGPPVDEDGEPIPDAPRPEPGAHLWVSCTLAGIDYDLVLTNEQAKYNPTAMQQVSDKRSVRAALRSLAKPRRGADAVDDTPSVVLRPLIGLNADGTPAEPDADTGEAVEVYAGYGQLFDPVDPAALLGSADAPGPAARVTCWGDGKLQLDRATDRVIERALGPVLGPEGAGALLAAREAEPGLGVEAWLKQVPGVTQEDRRVARFMITGTSQAQGLWVVARGPTRSWYSYAVRVYRPVQQDETLGAEALLEQSKTNAGGAGEDEDEAAQDALPDPVQRYDFGW
jgi:hypothetical protein